MLGENTLPKVCACAHAYKPRKIQTKSRTLLWGLTHASTPIGCCCELHNISSQWLQSGQQADKRQMSVDQSGDSEKLWNSPSNTTCCALSSQYSSHGFGMLCGGGLLACGQMCCYGSPGTAIDCCVNLHARQRNSIRNNMPMELMANGLSLAVGGCEKNWCRLLSAPGRLPYDNLIKKSLFAQMTSAAAAERLDFWSEVGERVFKAFVGVSLLLLLSVIAGHYYVCTRAPNFGTRFRFMTCLVGAVHAAG